MSTNKQWRKRPSPTGVPEAIECDGSELIMVLAKLRRMGRTPGEPENTGPNKWLVRTGGSTRKFIPDPYGQEDRTYGFYSFTQGMNGQLEY